MCPKQIEGQCSECADTRSQAELPFTLRSIVVSLQVVKGRRHVGATHHFLITACFRFSEISRRLSCVTFNTFDISVLSMLASCLPTADSSFKSSKQRFPTKCARVSRRCCDKRGSTQHWQNDAMPQITYTIVMLTQRDDTLRHPRCLQIINGMSGNTWWGKNCNHFHHLIKTQWIIAILRHALPSDLQCFAIRWNRQFPYTWN